MRFTPRVARVDEALLLEVSTTERLWGGRAALLDQLLASAPASTKSTKISISPLLGQGPTSFQALALLRLQLAGQPMPRRVPHDLPLHTLTALRPHVASLARMGCNTWGQLRALPRDGVARRLGAPALRALDCAFGDAPHTHTWLELPEVFALSAELPMLATSADTLLWSAHGLLQALQAWLQARQQGVLALELAWHHDLRKVDGMPVPPWQALPVRTAQPTQALGHLRLLLAENLARTPLAAPANQIALRALETVPMPQASASLLPPAGAAGGMGRSAESEANSESWHQLVERLSARLGADQVQGVALAADHRPERMQHWQPATQALQGGAIAPTAGQTTSRTALPDASLWPTWLLRPPQRLAVQGSRPCYLGPLRLVAGPHRLEAAWWEAAPEPSADAQPLQDESGGVTSGLVVRDYFVAHNDRVGHVWVFRERLPRSALSAPSNSVPSGTSAASHGEAGRGTWGRSATTAARQDRWFLHGIYG
ncbi:DNA polymerase Y family protein [Acidovorax sp. DW039]|uniref:DNA polymerase Y family protein n=1 Tax=Acidovorax sp. DW039 TaxID=3095606 RepID=UPI00308CE460|nr:DNA polymerase Y family protein [Acidovorax sp. DW039]